MVNRSPRITNIYYPLKGALGRKYLSKKLFCKPHMENLSTWVQTSLATLIPHWQYSVEQPADNSSDYSTPVLKRDKNNCYDGDTSSPPMLAPTTYWKSTTQEKCMQLTQRKKVLQYNSLAKYICIILRNFKREGWREKTKLIVWLEKGTYNVSKKS